MVASRARAPSIALHAHPDRIGGSGPHSACGGGSPIQRYAVSARRVFLFFSVFFCFFLEFLSAIHFIMFFFLHSTNYIVQTFVDYIYDLSITISVRIHGIYSRLFACSRTLALHLHALTEKTQLLFTRWDHIPALADGCRREGVVDCIWSSQCPPP